MFPALTFKFSHSVSRRGSISLCGKWLLTAKLPSSNQKKGAVGARLSFLLWRARWPPACWHHDKPHDSSLWAGTLESPLTRKVRAVLKSLPYGESAFLLLNIALRMWSGRLQGCLATSINHMHTGHWNI